MAMPINTVSGVSDAALLKNFSILYVEDDEDIRDQLVQFLKRRVGTLHVATNGQEGLLAYEAHKPDMVITDIQMPIMNGLEMAKKIKKISPSTSIVVTTAFNETKFFLEAIDIGIDKYVIKPVNTEVLNTVLLQCAHMVLTEVERSLSTAVFDNSSDAIMVSSHNNRIISVNPDLPEKNSKPTATH
jgi:YesN/AraC family two-component response regulator